MQRTARGTVGLTVLAATAVTLAFPASAAQRHTGKPEAQRIELSVSETDNRCGFPLRFEGSGVLIDRFWMNDDGSATEMVQLARGKFRLTNPANGKTLSSVDAEGLRIDYHANGSATIYSHGMHFLFTVPGEGKIAMAVGRLVVEFPDGFGGPRRVTFEAGLHQNLFPTICAYLD